MNNKDYYDFVLAAFSIAILLFSSLFISSIISYYKVKKVFNKQQKEHK
jgi:hypothetical protein